MAKNESNKPDDVKAPPENEAPAEESNAPTTPPTEIAGDTPAPETTVEEAAILAHEGEAALQKMGESEIEPPTPLDIGSKHIPDPGDIAVPFDKINEDVSEKQAATREAEKPPTPEKQETEKKTAPKKQTERQDKVAPQKAPGAGVEDTRQEWEKPLSEIEAEKKPKPRAEKQKPTVEKKAPKKEPEITPAQKGGQTRKAGNAKVIDFMEGKRTSPLPDGKPISDAKKKVPEKEETPPPDGPTLEERKQKLEKELREKYGIPKTDKPIEPWIAPEVEQVVRLPHEKLHSFKDHPFNVEKDAKFMAFVASIRAHGVTQPAIVRPDGKDGYEIISGHRRDLGSIEAEIPYTPCIIRALNDEQAIQQMVEDNVNNRDIGTMELAKALKMQLEAIKHQGARQALEGQDFTSDIDKRSNEIVAERNGMSVKQVQRHIALTRLVPSLQQMVDGKAVEGNKALKIAFTPAVEISYIKPKNQEYIAIAIEGQQSTPSLAQAQRMRKLEQEGMLKADVIDGIMLEEKKEVDKVIISSQELAQYFGKDKTPRDMKDQILKLLDEWKGQQVDLAKPEKKVEKEK